MHGRGQEGGACPRIREAALFCGVSVEASPAAKRAAASSHFYVTEIGGWSGTRRKGVRPMTYGREGLEHRVRLIVLLPAL